jgi:hypothetical protein
MISFLPRTAARSATFTCSLISTAVLALLNSSPSYACSACGCAMSTDWTGPDWNGVPASMQGVKVDFRYDFVNQNELRSGTEKIDPSAIELPSDEEIQQSTLTRYYTLGLDYSINPSWGLNIQLPWLSRDHGAIAEDTADVTSSHTGGLGDVRVLGRYTGLRADGSIGLQFGLKLPTGTIHHNFSDGPAAGEVLDRGLQNGTGTTDLLLGAYYLGSFASRWQHAEQIQLKQALNSMEAFRPSTQGSLNLSLRYRATDWLMPQLQVNAKVEGRELGEQGDYENSGSRALYLSPGATVSAGAHVSGYGFVQLPVYQDYTGKQLAPPYIVTVGLSYRY